MGKKLDSKHPVHHVDGDVKNNSNNNLVVCEDAGYHYLLHRKQNPNYNMSDRRGQKLNIRLAGPQIQELKKMAKKVDVSFAELVRRAIDFYLEYMTGKKKGVSERNPKRGG